MRALLVAEGSGGHLIPALQVAERLAGLGARVTVWHAQRRQTAPLAEALTRSPSAAGLDALAIPEPAAGLLGRLRYARDVWRRAARWLAAEQPDVVAGFGGRLCAPVILAARLRGTACLVHEQNVVMGRTNRWLSRWVNRVAVSFPATRLPSGVAAVITGLPIRPDIGAGVRARAARHFGLEAERPTLLVLGGSQGSRAVNEAVTGLLPLLSPEEDASWQFIHLTGMEDLHAVRGAYAARRLAAFTAPFILEMHEAYAHADVVIGRSGASSLAEMARCRLPAILIPYPHAGGHQRANARLAASHGGAAVLEASAATPARLLPVLRRLMGSASLRMSMGEGMRALDHPDAAGRLAQELITLARADGRLVAHPVMGTAARRRQPVEVR